MKALPICCLFTPLFTYSTAVFSPAVSPPVCQVDFIHSDLTESCNVRLSCLYICDVELRTGRWMTSSRTFTLICLTLVGLNLHLFFVITVKNT